MWIRGSAVATAAVLALVGCSADADPKPLPPLPSVSPSPAVRPIPPEATPETAQGAAAFARYFFAAVNDALTTRDGSYVRAISNRGCAGCNNLIGAAEEQPKEGERVEGGLFDVLFAEASPVEAGEVLVDVRYAVTELRVVAADGTLLRSKPAGDPVDAQVRLARANSGWRVYEFRNLA